MPSLCPQCACLGMYYVGRKKYFGDWEKGERKNSYRKVLVRKSLLLALHYVTYRVQGRVSAKFCPVAGDLDSYDIDLIHQILHPVSPVQMDRQSRVPTSIGNREVRRRKK